MRHLLVLSILAVAVCVFAPARAEITQCTNITTLPAVISTQGVYCLKQDLATSINSGAAIEIRANNVTLDCNSWKVGGLAGGSGNQAIGVLSERLNLTIRNCAIRGFGAGIMLGGDTAGHLIEDNRLDQNLAGGIYVKASGSIVRRNRVLDTGGHPLAGWVYGIATDGAGNLVADNVITNIFTADPQNDVTGIDTYGAATEIARNFITGVGNANSRGINAQGRASSIRDNTLINNPEILGTAISGGDSYSQCKGNSIYGYNKKMIGCIDAFGNSMP